MVCTIFDKECVNTFSLLKEYSTSKVHCNTVKTARLGYIFLFELASFGCNCISVVYHLLFNYILELRHQLESKLRLIDVVVNSLFKQIQV